MVSHSCPSKCGLSHFPLKVWSPAVVPQRAFTKLVPFNINFLVVAVPPNVCPSKWSFATLPAVSQQCKLTCVHQTTRNSFPRRLCLTVCPSKPSGISQLFCPTVWSLEMFFRERCVPSLCHLNGYSAQNMCTRARKQTPA